MENTQATVQILNDLIQINNDRIEGYQRASKDLKEDDADLKSLFTRLIGQSQGYKLALGTEVSAFGKDIETGTTTSGKIHRVWLDVKAAFTGHDTHNVLEECEFGEDAILKAYRTALEDENLPAYLRETISQQESELLDAHDEVKALRDSVH
ncbi:PA2169 family four-helix-bundle protein [Mucilaginibacter sp. SMC90]|uniref:PA2169 family four-helix-bundle protein n=1 Tax=Mucilaginibacter sp. SMC90 TaxID=2929803 RepID=UPI001FB39768|nr:PA2169 family four-helix-bundle protein [Mucilaginibacter sp. SMC90]UOE51806.1 PA2169 family four-helix-bundle protein [Mucilaginibacter sp. SMC90]